MPLPNAREIIGVILYLEDVREEWDVVVLLMPVTCFGGVGMVGIIVQRSDNNNKIIFVILVCG
jgi:hypothetical protein